MDPISWGLVGGLGYGAVQNILDRGKEGRDRKLASVVTRYSPWTGMRADKVRESDLTGSLLSGAATGVDIGQKFMQAASYDDYIKSLSNYYKGGGPLSKANRETTRADLVSPENMNYKTGLVESAPLTAEDPMASSGSVEVRYLKPQTKEGVYDFSKNKNPMYNPTVDRIETYGLDQEYPPLGTDSLYNPWSKLNQMNKNGFKY